MKKLYAKPSMAVNYFDTMDCTNVNVLSTAATKKGSVTYERFGLNIIDGTNTNLHS